MRPRPLFLVLFAWRDLSDRRGLGSTLVIVGTLGLLTALSAAAILVPPLAEKRRLAAMRAEPFATTLWAWDRNGSFGGRVSPERRQDLEARLRSELGERLVAVRGFDEVRYEFPVDLGGEQGLSLAAGRTFDPASDPSLKELALSAGRTPSADRPLGLLASPQLLELMRLPENEPLVGRTLTIRLERSGVAKGVEVVGVLRESLPLNHLFAVTEAQERLLGVIDDVPARAVRSGPLPNTWPDPTKLSPAPLKELEDLFALYKLDAPEEATAGGRKCWEVRFNGTAPHRLTTWRAIFARVAEVFERAGHPDAENGAFAAATPLGAVEAEPEAERRPGSDWVGVQVQDLGDLTKASAAVRAKRLQANEGVIGQLLALGEAAEAGARVLQSVMWAVWLVAALNVVAMQSLRLRPKLPEFGLLRAVGIRRRSLVAVGALQGVMVWNAGLIFAGLILLAAGPVVRGLDAAFWPSPEVWNQGAERIGWFLAANLGLCVLSGCWAMGRAGGRAPALAMAGS